ncbi:MAG: MBL fold metallo-hydrolase, partial [Candidatus Krumholzibacteria bacterium]|nr:MBL fold metallo-hydrolase [Candidatus Krumholzibacteria bacterium]
MSRGGVPREDFDRALASLRGVAFDETVRRGAVAFTMRRAQHLLGAAFVEVDVDTGGGAMRIVFSGDLGSGGSLLLPPLERCERADYLVMESTYGGSDRVSADDPAERYAPFAAAVGAALERGGDVLIPAFTLGRTQEVVAALDLFADRGVIPAGTLIYTDSPTANRITRIYREHAGELSGTARELYRGEPLHRATHREVRSRTTIKVHDRSHAPAVFVSSSGDLEYANSPRHLVRMAGDPDNLLCIVGWQSPGSVGARLAAGDSTVLVRCREDNRTQEYWISPALEIASFGAFSGHADGEGLVAWAGAVEGVRSIFLVHGEPAQAEALARRLRERHGLRAQVPSAGERVFLETPGR